MLTRMHPQSILGRISAEVRDPRSRRGRTYPLAAILGMLLIGALEGEGSLRGMWRRGRKSWRALIECVDRLGPADPPALATVWYVLKRVAVEELGAALSAWVEPEAVVSVDGKALRGSRRQAAPPPFGQGGAALQVLAMAGQQGAQVLAQRVVEGGDEGAAAVALLREVPLEGRVVSIDAGLMKRPVVKVIVEKGGTTSGC